MPTLTHWGVLETLLFALAVCSSAYTAVAILRTAFFRIPADGSGSFTPPVTILKPVCGDEPRLYERLLSFCRQDYPAYQIVFGVRYASDAALPVVRRLLAELPGLDLGLVVDDRIYGSNYKLSNLTNMYGAAKHDILVVADSDGLVEPGYLRAVVAPFEDRKVGAVTCLYVGQPIGGTASDIGAAFINDWFIPSVAIALTVGQLRFCFGATMAITRDALDRIGGFVGLAPYLADDYLLGQWVSDLGLEVRLSPARVVTEVFEPDLATLFRHELRWARTFRTVRPVGWPLTLITDAFVWALLFLFASGGSALGWTFLGAAVLLRLTLRGTVRRRFRVEGTDRFWLVPVRDLLSFVERVASLFGHRIDWRGEELRVRPTGQLEPKGGVSLDRS